VIALGRPKRRRLGQNFLIDSTIAERIVALLGDEPSRVLEIGPGRGALTEPLLDRFDRVLALEMDESLVSPLVQQMGGRGLEVRHDDALAVDLDELLASAAPWQVASNLPYSVGTAIVRRLLPRVDLINRVVVMLQREVARRLVARPGGKGHGLLALERAAWADATFIFDVHPRAFRPAPKVVSSVVVLDLKPPVHARELVDSALALAARALTKPRKMLSNAVGDSVVIDQIEGAGIDPNARPGTLDLDAWIELARRL
jgi:16S rRNA (adenine1518-N6/adenine1519-N6)-dimethyltransferase